MKKITILLLIFSFPLILTYGQNITVQIDATADRQAISPYIYGKNNCLSDNASLPLSSSEWQLMREAGVRMVRENGGNNATKYNWRAKLSSHPDWYNNVYSHDWDFASQSLRNNMPGTACMWAFQLIGYAASNKENNFNDWSYNGSDWWKGVAQNLAGGGTVNPDQEATKALVDGNPDLYLTDWSADSTTGILLHWFGNNGLGLNPLMFRYWNMDNEPEIWGGTHDDVMPVQPSAEEFMQKYFAVAKSARAIYPGIKLMGPVTCNEWQWFNYNDELISYKGNSYCWLEYFILRISEEQKASGVKLLDIIDLHFYPNESEASEIVQLHRIYFDKSYDYPGANGIKKLNGGWDESLTKEYVFERCREWLKKYIGENHGVTFSISETAIENDDANVAAVWYASTLGTFTNEGVEVFTPWEWQTGMWEILHLFSRYGKTLSVQSVSSDETTVSAYSSLNYKADSMTIFLVNRSLDQTISTTVSLSNFTASDGKYSTLRISGLTNNESFVSHTNNALQSGTVTVASNSFSYSLPPLSVSAVILKGSSTPDPDPIINSASEIFQNSNLFSVKQNRNGNSEISFYIENPMLVQIDIFDIQGKLVKNISNNRIQGEQSFLLDNSMFNSGVYFILFKSGDKTDLQKLVIL